MVWYCSTWSVVYHFTALTFWKEKNSGQFDGDGNKSFVSEKDLSSLLLILDLQKLFMKVEDADCIKISLHNDLKDWGTQKKTGECSGDKTSFVV